MSAGSLQATDLRIGNIVDTPYGQYPIVDVMCDCINTDFVECLPYDEVGGVILDANWLVRGGFTHLPAPSIIGDTYMLDLGRHRRLSVSNVDNANQVVFLQSYDEKDYRNTTDLICLWNFDYDGRTAVHQLQNIVSIFGTELQFKPIEA